MNGILYGVGVGPGDFELLTLKAVRIIKECEIIAVPNSGATENIAFNIAKLAVENQLSDKEILKIFMPMTKDSKKLLKAHEEAVSLIINKLASGKNIAFLTLGDPTVYSTYMYIHKSIMDMGFDAQIVSGIPSFCAAAAKLNISLAQGDEVIHIIPASYENVEDTLLLSGTKVLMKSGKQFEKVKNIISKNENIKEVFMIENCTMDNEKIFQSLDETPTLAGYFSIFVVK